MTMIAVDTIVILGIVMFGQWTATDQFSASSRMTSRGDSEGLRLNP